MTSCYGKIGNMGKEKIPPNQEDNLDSDHFNFEERKTRMQTSLQPFLPSFPLLRSLKDGRPVELDIMLPEEYNFAMTLLNEEIEGGNSWPFTHPLSREEFLSYFVSYDAFTVRLKKDENKSSKVLVKDRGDELEDDQNSEIKDKVCGIFYIKPNFPGRCKHICNGGFITNKNFRNLGVATIMANEFKTLAKLLSYKGSLFNLVFGTNPISQSLWKKCGFQELAVIPKCAFTKLENGEEVLTDAHQFYCDFS